LEVIRIQKRTNVQSADDEEALRKATSGASLRALSSREAERAAVHLLSTLSGVQLVNTEAWLLYGGAGRKAWSGAPNKARKKLW